MTEANNGPGKSLRHAREAANLTVADVAQRTRLQETIIHAIEADDYQNMPGLMFVRGYLRAYANLLNLSADEAVAAFDALGLDEMVNDRPRYVPQPTDRRKQQIIRFSLIGLGILLIFNAALWWHNQRNLSLAKLAKPFTGDVALTLKQGEKHFDWTEHKKHKGHA